jgi:hypothetical protein
VRMPILPCFGKGLINQFVDNGERSRNQLLLTDILKVFYEPHKVFKQIVQNPKYLGALIVFIIFVAAQTGFFYTLYTKTNYEQTSPNINTLGAWTADSTLWAATPAGVVIAKNSNDFLNNTNYGNGSLQFTLSNGNNVSLTLGKFDNVVCGPEKFQNLSVRIKFLDPQSAPSTATLTLFTLSASDYYQYDLTSQLSNVGVWNNVTVPVGSQAAGWQSSGSPAWGNVSVLKLTFAFAGNSIVSVLVDGLFFRGFYETPIKTDFGGFMIYVLQLVTTQFLFQWLVFTGLLFIIVKGLKGTIVWKPLFVAVGMALVVTVVQSLINLASTSTLSTLYYPVEFLTGLSGEAQIISTSIAASTSTYSLIAGVFQLVTYGWIVALTTFIVRALQPEFTWIKCFLSAAAAFIVTILLLSLLGV